MVEQIKTILFEDTSKIIKMLEELKCHKINPYSKNEIRCALPDGETGTSVQIILNDFLPAYIYSRNDYENYEIKDIISFVQFLLKCSFYHAVRWMCDFLNIDFEDQNGINPIIRNQSETIKVLKSYIRKDNEILINKPIREGLLKDFPLYIVQEWIEEGIDKEIQALFEIRIDEKRCRWIIPIRNEDNKLVAIKGRTYLPNSKELDIPKYLYYKEHKDSKYYNSVLFGINHNYEDIKRKNEVIVVESEKSVMKAKSMGFDNVVSISGHDINRNIKKKILQLQTNVVVALDKDIPIKNVLKECNKLSMFTNVYYIYDYDNLLGAKDSPLDCGLGIWLSLYDNMKRVR